MISIIVPCSHMASIDGRAQLHIKEDCIITLITTKDAITDIIALLLLILFCTLTKVEQREKEGFVLHANSYSTFFLNTACPGGVNS